MGKPETQSINQTPLESEMPHSPISRILFISCGIWLIGLGLYFMLLRPPLLPEDWRFMGANPTEVQATIPGLALWLRHVFRVLGGFIMGTGLLTLLVAMKGFSNFNKWTWVVLALTGIFSVGTMSLINFQLHSDFKWLLLLPSLLWVLGLLLPIFPRKNRGTIGKKQGS